MPAGRPIKFKSVKELEDKIENYFASCFEEQWFDEIVRDKLGVRKKVDGKWKTEPVKKLVQVKPITITGLAVALETTRRTLLDYETMEQGSISTKEKEKYSHTIKKAKGFIENVLEEGMLAGKINPAAAIFNAKNNFGWKDKVEQEITGKDGKDLMPTPIYGGKSNV
jgi:hypothetical protein